MTHRDLTLKDDSTAECNLNLSRKQIVDYRFPAAKRAFRDLGVRSVIDISGDVSVSFTDKADNVRLEIGFVGADSPLLDMVVRPVDVMALNFKGQPVGIQVKIEGLDKQNSISVTHCE
jgi:hypothetical protein